MEEIRPFVNVTIAYLLYFIVLPCCVLTPLFFIPYVSYPFYLFGAYKLVQWLFWRLADYVIWQMFGVKVQK